MPDIVILTPNTHGDEKTKTIIDKYPEKCGGKTYDYENEFCDIRVGENVVYKKVTITGSIEGQTYSRTWMAENLRYKPSTEGSLCRDDYDSDCSKYGRFYTFDAANPEGENICPEGWIMPTIIDYVDLVKALGNDYGKLKSETAWKDDKGNDVSFSNESGFSALPVGAFDATQGLMGSSSYALFWTSTYDATNYNGFGELQLASAGANVNSTAMITHYDYFYSVRCIMIENND